MFAIAGNKVDLESAREVDSFVAEAYARSVGAMYVETSAKTAEGASSYLIQTSRCHRQAHFVGVLLLCVKLIAASPAGVQQLFCEVIERVLKLMKPADELTAPPAPVRLKEEPKKESSCC